MMYLVTPGQVPQAKVLRPTFAQGLRVAALVAVMTGCSGDGPQADPVRAAATAPEQRAELEREFAGRRFRTAEARVYALPGRALLVPIVLAPGVTAAGGITVEGETGEPWRAALWRVGVSGGDSAPTGDGLLSAWMGGVVGTGSWGASNEPDAADRLPIGAWVVVTEVPDQAGAVMVIDGARVPIWWVHAPAEAGRAALESAAQEIWGRVDSAEGAPLWRMLQAMHDSPLLRWRAALALSAAGVLPDGASPPGLVRVEGERLDVLGLLARQSLERWSAAVGRVGLADEALASALARRLLAGVRLQGVIAPAWPPEGPDLDRLLDALLDPSLSPAEAATRARSWLAVQPEVVTWVIDDSGAGDVRTGSTSATLGVANVRGTPAVCTTQGEGVAASDPVAAPAWTAVSIPAAIAGEEAAHGASVRVVEVRNSGAVRRVGVVSIPLPAAPPGFSIGPFQADWTCQAWLSPAAAGVPVSTNAASSTAARLVRVRSPDGGARWDLVIECEEARGNEGPDPGGWVEVWLGPMGRSSRAVRIEPSGRVVELSAGEGRAAGVQAAERDGSGWRVVLPVPPEAIGPGGVLRVGMVRVDGQGSRSAWPRAMMPWQTEPGRLSIDLTQWD